MTSALTKVDTTNCDREPIHLSGAIQPHGVLLALEPDSLRVLRASDNLQTFFGIDAADVIGRHVEQLLGQQNSADIAAVAAHPNILEANPIAFVVQTDAGPRNVDAVLHRSAGSIVVELELIAAPRLTLAHEFQRVVRSSIDSFAAVRTVQQLCAAVVGEIGRLTSFDRVMIYRFDDAWNGEVVAEQLTAGMEPFLRLHYPASDIPPQARALFKQNWIRFIPDAGYVPAAILPADLERNDPLDLTASVLRSVSPLHIEYLQNMGVAASMSVSLLRNGKLWGLIACHHRTPKMVAYHVRLACEIVGRTMSLHLGTLEDNEDTAYRMRIKAGEMRLLDAMSRATDVWGAFAADETALMSLVGADGIAIRFGDECRLVGSTPELDDVNRITEWLATRTTDDLFVTESLPSVAPDFAPLAGTACGIIAVALSRAKRSWVVWFRPELLVTIDWGGNPAKAPSTDGLRLTPRKSFAIWSEVVRLRSRRWLPCEIDATREWSRFVTKLIVERAEELERANRDLAEKNIELASLLRSNVELDAFAHIASHDLKEPLRGIQNYASFLMEDYGTVVGQDGRDKLNTLVRLSGRMEALIESLLTLSRAGRGDQVRTPTDVQRVVTDVMEMYAPRLAQCDGTVSVVTPLPHVYVEGARLSQVFSNLISNAVKYSERPPHIEIGVDDAHEPPRGIVDPATVPPAGRFVTVFVRDNGIGIRAKHLAAIFQMFKRLHAAGGYGGGTGAGLAIAKKIIERHAGEMWAESTLGSGTTFYFTLPLEPQCTTE